MIGLGVIHYEANLLLDKGTFIKDVCSSYPRSEKLLDYQILADYLGDLVFSLRPVSSVSYTKYSNFPPFKFCGNSLVSFLVSFCKMTHLA